MRPCCAPRSSRSPCRRLGLCWASDMPPTATTRSTLHCARRPQAAFPRVRHNAHGPSVLQWLCHGRPRTTSRSHRRAPARPPLPQITGSCVAKHGLELERSAGGRFPHASPSVKRQPLQARCAAGYTRVTCIRMSCKNRLRLPFIAAARNLHCGTFRVNGANVRVVKDSFRRCGANCAIRTHAAYFNPNRAAPHHQVDPSPPRGSLEQLQSHDGWPRRHWHKTQVSPVLIGSPAQSLERPAETRAF